MESNNPVLAEHYMNTSHSFNFNNNKILYSEPNLIRYGKFIKNNSLALPTSNVYAMETQLLPLTLSDDQKLLLAQARTNTASAKVILPGLNSFLIKP